jgi:16S rRNA (guanine966-N2)-methyltransferase
VSRIVAGRRGGHRLVMPSHDRTRPTSDRVRESAFNLIADWAGTAGEPADSQLDRFSFLDLFAGSGAVALEAASRGASPVVAVERDASTASLARRNAEALDLGVRVVTAGVEAFLGAREPQQFDVVWLDPPYALTSDAIARVGVLALDGGWLAEDGLLVAERATRDAAPMWPPALQRRWSRRYGETTLHFATREDA